MKASDLAKIVSQVIAKYDLKKIDIAGAAGIAPSELTNYTSGRKGDFNASTFFRLIFAMPVRARITLLSDIFLESLSDLGDTVSPDDLAPYIYLRRGAIATMIARAIDKRNLDRNAIAIAANISPSELEDYFNNKGEIGTEAFFRLISSLPYELIARIMLVLTRELFRIREERAIARNDYDLLDDL